MLVTAVCLAAVLSGRIYFLHTISSDWPRIAHGLDSAFAEAITSDIAHFTNSTIAVLDKIAADTSISRNTTMDPGYAERALDALHSVAAEDGATMELRDSGGTLLAFAGRGLPGSASSGLRRDSIWVIRDELRLLLVAGRRFRNDVTLLAARPLTSSYPASERFIEENTLQARLAEIHASEISIITDETSPLLRDGRYIAVPISLGARTFGHVVALRSNPEVHRQNVAGSFDRVIAFLLVVLVVLLSALAVRRIRRLTRPVLRFLLITAVLWTARAILLAADAGSTLLPEQLLNPAVFASAFGFGAASSLAELTVTLLVFGLTLCFAVAEILERKVHPPLPRALSIAVIAAAGVTLPFMLRGAVATLQSFVSDSSFNFDTIAPFSTDPLFLLMQIDVFLLCAGILAATGMALVLARRAMKHTGFRITQQVMLATVTAGVSFAILLLTTRRLLIPAEAYAVYIGVFLGATVRWQRVERIFTMRYGVLMLAIVLCSALGSSLLLRQFTRERRYSEMEAIGDQLAQPFDGWAGALVEQTLAHIAAAIAETTPGEGGFRRPEHVSAFSYWLSSPLSDQRNNSAVLMFQEDGTALTQFSVGIHPGTLLDASLIAAVRKGRDTTMRIQLMNDPRRRSFSAGIRVLGELGSGRTIAAAVVESLDPLSASSQGVDVLRSAPAARANVPEDRFVVSTFRDGRLTASSDERFPRRAVIPDTVQRAFVSGQDRVWAEFETPDGKRPSLFIHSDSSTLCLSPGSEEYLFTLYRWLRFALVHAVTGIAIVILFIWASGSFPRLRSLRFSTRLRIAFISVAAIPVMLVWIFAKGFVAESQERMTAKQLHESLTTLRGTIEENAGTASLRQAIDSLSDAACIDLADRAGRELAVYHGLNVAASSRPELYAAGIFSARLHPNAYRALMLRGADFHVTTERVAGFPYFVGHLALREPDGTLAGVIASPTLFESDRAEEAAIRSSAAILLGTVLIAVLVALASITLARQISRPLRILTAATRDIAHGELTRRVRVKASPEIDELVSSFNTMTDQLRHSRDELAAAERDLAWKEMAKQVAHEIRNPLTPMKLAAQHLQRAQADDAPNLRDIITKVTGAIIDQIDSLSRIADEFSRFARMPKRTVTTLDPGVVLIEAVSLFRHHSAIEWELSVADDLPRVAGDREEFSRALTNVLRNAVQAISGTGHIHASAVRAESHVRIAIHDTGCGIPAALFPRIFEPNFSTKTEGMGLGLAIVKKIIDDMGGSIDIESVLHQGTTVIISLPGTFSTE